MQSITKLRRSLPPPIKRQLADRITDRAHILEAGRVKAIALRDSVITRGDKGELVPSINEIKKATIIRFEVKADTPEIRGEVERRVQQLRSEFPGISFQVFFGD